MQTLPYLFFEGRCEEASDFYRRALGAEVMSLMRFKDNPEPEQNGAGCNRPAGSENKVMHMSFRIGDTMLMASDGFCSGKPNFQGFSLAVTAPDEAKAKQMFGSLSEGGEVRMPLGRTFFSPAFGMVADRFGVNWMVYVAPSEAMSAQ